MRGGDVYALIIRISLEKTKWLMEKRIKLLSNRAPILGLKTSILFDLLNEGRRKHNSQKTPEYFRRYHNSGHHLLVPFSRLKGNCFDFPIPLAANCKGAYP